MFKFAEARGSRHRLAYLAGVLVLIALSLSLIAGRANAGQVYWANQNSISYSLLDDSGGGFLTDSFEAVRNIEGTAIDTANGRIYIAENSPDRIVWFDLDGVGAGVVKTAAGTVDHPTNISIDPETQTLYWANDDSPGSIGFAFVNETGGGILAQEGETGAHVQQPSRIAIDMLHHRLYWWNEGSDEFSWVTTSGLFGGNLSTPGLGFSQAGKMGGIAVEPFSTPQELYFVNNEAEGIYHTDPVLGGEPERILGAYGEHNTAEPIGLAFDEIGEKFYWANSGIDSEPSKAIGTATVFGHPANVSVFPEAPIHSPVFAAILKEPNALSLPQLSVSGTTMSCASGEWEGDHPGASVFAAPTSSSFQWRKGSALIGGANGASFTATESGSYSCEVIAENAAGETVSVSRPTTMTFPAKPKPATPSSPTSNPKSKSTQKSAAVGAALASSKPVRVKAGGTAVVAVKLTNSGGATSGSAKVCGKLTKQAKKGLRAPRCATVKSVAAGKTVLAGLKVKTLAGAKGTYKLTVEVSGAGTGSMTAKIQVTGARKGKR